MPRELLQSFLRNVIAASNMALARVFDGATTKTVALSGYNPTTGDDRVGSTVVAGGANVTLTDFAAQITPAVSSVRQQTLSSLFVAGLRTDLHANPADLASRTSTSQHRFRACTRPVSTRHLPIVPSVVNCASPRNLGAVLAVGATGRRNGPISVGVNWYSASATSASSPAVGAVVRPRDGSQLTCCMTG